MTFPNREAARKAAALITQRHELTPPVDVCAVAEVYATVEPADWPESGVDGLTVQAQGQRPQIFYRADQPKRRARFTVAHELGHVVLGWHIGDTGCEINSAAGRSADEKEADTFAAGLLLPNRWLKGLLEQHQGRPLGISEVIETLGIADASVEASLIALASSLPPGWAFDVEGVRTYASWHADDSAADIAAARMRGTAKLHGKTIGWCRLFDSRDFIPGVTRPVAEGGLADAIAATESPLDLNSINGKIGGYLGAPRARTLVDASDQFAYVLWRFEVENQLIAAHDGFKTWLSWRIEDLIAKREKRAAPRIPAL